jgi:hypothetical protein
MTYKAFVILIGGTMASIMLVTAGAFTTNISPALAEVSAPTTQGQTYSTQQTVPSSPHHFRQIIITIISVAVTILKRFSLRMQQPIIHHSKAPFKLR